MVISLIEPTVRDALLRFHSSLVGWNRSMQGLHLVASVHTFFLPHDEVLVMNPVMLPSHIIQ